MCKRGIAAVLACFLCILFLRADAERVYAAGERRDFSCDIEFLKQEEDRYVIQVTAENRGKDFTGYVRLVFASEEAEPCAYDTEITLPEGGKKQFILTIPERMADLSNGICVVSFLDGKGRQLQELTKRKVFGSSAGGITMGILSDDYDSLTYLDLGGQQIQVTNSSMPVRLIELDAANLDAYLDGLYYLVIDHFNVESLGEEKISAILDWVSKGGWLMIGTGEYGADTLGGFEKDLSIAAGPVSEPGESNFLYANSRQGYYYAYEEAGVDFRNMKVASFQYTGTGPVFEESVENPAVYACIGDGEVTVYACSLADSEFRKGAVYSGMQLLQEAAYNSNSYGIKVYGNLDYRGRQALSAIDSEHTNLDFSALILLILAYVVLVGPLLYLLLRAKKRSEWYWGAAPLLGILFIGGVYLFGRNIRVADTKVYSVSLQEAGSSRVDTYYEAYRSGTKGWRLLLNDNYEVAGAGFGRNGYYNSTAGDYHYVVQNGGEGLYIGMKPEENFESGYLYASGRAEPTGTLTGSELALDLSGSLSGTLTNDTGQDLALFAVYCGDYLAVFNGVKAGESIDIAAELLTDRCVYTNLNSNGYGGDIYYDLCAPYGAKPQGYSRDEMTALYIGLELSREKIPDGYSAALVGLTEDAQKTVAGACDEYAYRCLSSYAELEVNGYAAN